MGTINLAKGQAAVSLRKTAAIQVHATWPARTDYDLYALVLNRDGSVVHVAMFGAHGHPPIPRYKGIEHSGDATRGKGTSTETLTMNLDDSIAAVVPVAYSAQSNGTGSFRRYKVGLAVDNGAGDRVEYDAASASDNDRIYSCVPVVIHNGADGNVWIEPVELYSRPGSENRPAVTFDSALGRAIVTMDVGPLNNYK